jgi:aerobic-type carbon monoxide dehydrogenase small subunit (CoxS/CutS family)
MKRLFELTVNGDKVEAAVEPNRTQVDYLPEELRLTGTKQGCGHGDCGASAVHHDGVPVNSCLVLALETAGREVTTIEGVADGNTLHPLQQAFVDEGAIQCGFCTPGMVLTGLHLLKHNPAPTEEEARLAISGNLCRCTGYQNIVTAITRGGQS